MQHATKEQWNGFIADLRKRGKAAHAAALAAAAVTFTHEGVTYTAPHGWESGPREMLAVGATLPIATLACVRSIFEEDEDEVLAAAPSLPHAVPFYESERAPSRRAPTADEQITMLVLEMTTNDRHAGAGWFDDVLAQERRMAAPRGSAGDSDNNADVRLARLAMGGDL
ncbi:MAG: hypothetical protein U0270_07665 [Labilithrix sp.]